MSVETGLIGLAVMLVLLLLRVPIAIAMMLVSFAGIASMLGLQPAIGVLTATPYEFVASWTLSAVPMFLMMGYVAFQTGMTRGLFDLAKLLLSRLPGGLAVASIFACAGFASVSGSSVATAAAMGRMAVPEMIQSGYRPSFAAGALAAGGTVGALIPPSILMILYGVFSETSVTAVFLGGISIGLITALVYSLLVIGIAILRPDVIPSGAAQIDGISLGATLRTVWPLLVLIGLIFGGLFGGFFTATEAGAVGALGALVISAAMGTLTWQAFKSALFETLATTSALFIVGIGAVMLTKFLAFSGAGSLITSWVTNSDLGYIQLMLIIVVTYLILGMFLEPFGAMLITLPIFLPILEASGVSLVWFGVFLVKLLEVGMVTPPLGMNVFVVRSVSSDYVTLTDVFRGVLPFIIVDLLLIALMVLWPDFVTYLPDILA
jgi:tripartite ATP-independent transporter DctM subunit